MGFKLKTRTMFPADVSVQTPILLTKLGISYDFSVDMNALAASLAGISNTYTSDQLFAGMFGYGGVGTGGAVTQITSRTTGVTLNKACGSITLFSAAGSATYASFTVTNSTVAATDTIRVCQKSGTDLYETHVTAVAAGSFRITFRTTGGVTVEQPVFNFAVIKGVAS